MTHAIEISNLRKIYSFSFGRKKITALDGIDIHVSEGELFGLLGPNGAGKTTTVKILLGLTRATEGTASINGKPVSSPESRRHVGYLPEGHRFPGYLTARETLSIFGRMSGVDPATLKSRMLPLLERLGIAQWIDVKVKKFSKGMTQRLGLASALIHEPTVLLLDEPTDGVDPVGRREIRDLLREEAQKGRTILVNSHLLSEIELTCDRVAVLRRGKVAAEGRIDELTKPSSFYKFAFTPMNESTLNTLSAEGMTFERSNGHLLTSIRDLEQLNLLIDRLRASGASLSEVSPVRSTLEDVFVDLVKTAGTGGDMETRP